MTTVQAQSASDTEVMSLSKQLNVCRTCPSVTSSIAYWRAGEDINAALHRVVLVTEQVILVGNYAEHRQTHQTFLDLIESYSVNAVGVVNDETAENALALNALYTAWVKRMRDEMGVKCQVVCYNHAADYEGVVNIKNAVTDSGWSAASLVYWVTGVVAGMNINESATNLIYNGEFTVNANYTQNQLEAAIDAGEFVIHKVENNLRILTDINSLVTTTVDKSVDFKKNQVIRVIDEIALSIAHIFNTKYLGRIPNDADGRIALWSDIVAHHRELERVRAIENFDDSAVVVEAGVDKGAVVVDDGVSVVCAMEKLYMTCVVA